MLREQVNIDFQSIGSPLPSPLKEEGFDVETIVKQHEEHMKSIRDKVDLTSFDFTNVAKSEVMARTCTLCLSNYLGTMNKMKMDRDIWKNRL